MRHHHESDPYKVWTSFPPNSNLCRTCLWKKSPENERHTYPHNSYQAFIGNRISPNGKMTGRVSTDYSVNSIPVGRMGLISVHHSQISDNNFYPVFWNFTRILKIEKKVLLEVSLCLCARVRVAHPNIFRVIDTFEKAVVSWHGEKLYPPLVPAFNRSTVLTFKSSLKQKTFVPSK